MSVEDEIKSLKKQITYLWVAVVIALLLGLASVIAVAVVAQSICHPAAATVELQSGRHVRQLILDGSGEARSLEVPAWCMPRPSKMRPTTGVIPHMRA